MFVVELCWTTLGDEDTHMTHERSTESARGLHVAMSLIGAVVLLALATGLWSSVSADDIASRADEHAHDHGDHASTLDHNGRFTGPQVEWPPRHRDASDIGAVPVTDLDSNVDEVYATQFALRDEVVAAEIGGRYAVSSAIDMESAFGAGSTQARTAQSRSSSAGDKYGPADTHRITIFSYENNQTVHADVTNGRVVSYETVPAAVEQPALIETEQDQAIAIARSWWEAQNNERIDALEGFAIRAFQSNGDYFPVRMVYVSFHLSQTDKPELLTMVDLTNEIVTDGWLDR